MSDLTNTKSLASIWITLNVIAIQFYYWGTLLCLCSSHLFTPYACCQISNYTSLQFYNYGTRQLSFNFQLRPNSRFLYSQVCDYSFLLPLLFANSQRFSIHSSHAVQINHFLRKLLLHHLLLSSTMNLSLKLNRFLIQSFSATSSNTSSNGKATLYLTIPENLITSLRMHQIW